MPSIQACLVGRGESSERIESMKSHIHRFFYVDVAHLVIDYLAADQETVNQRTTFFNILKSNKIDPTITDVNDSILIEKILITPLILAAKHSLGKVMTAFLDNGAQVNKQSLLLTALTTTIDNGNEELTKLLITYKASQPLHDRRKPARFAFYAKCKGEVEAIKNVVKPY